MYSLEFDRGHNSHYQIFIRYWLIDAVSVSLLESQTCRKYIYTRTHTHIHTDTFAIDRPRSFKNGKSMAEWNFSYEASFSTTFRYLRIATNSASAVIYIRRFRSFQIFYRVAIKSNNFRNYLRMELFSFFSL